MVKQLLFGTLAAMTVVAAGAETKVYQSDELGDVFGISANGKYAAITDEENIMAYLWSLETGEIKEISEELGSASTPSAQRVAGTSAYGVADDGTVVGSIKYADGVDHPAIYKDGKWTLLPMSEHAMNTNCAIAITGDCKYIGGYQFYLDKSSELGGRYRPCRWTLQDDGTYSLNSYENLDLLDHQGFFPRCMSPDGKLIGGTMYCGVNSTMAVYLDFETGEMFYDHKVTSEKKPFIYKGRYVCRDADGNQYFTDDPNDPNIEYYTEVYIDGVRDNGEGDFQGFISGVDNNGCFYGAHSVASNVNQEEGTGTVRTGALILNTVTGEWIDNFDVNMYANGLNKGQYIFGAGDELYVDGNATTSTAKFGFSTGRTIANISKSSLDGRVLGGSTYEINPASGEPQYFPLIIVLDEGIVDPTLGVKLTVGEGGNAVVNVADGVIDVQGAARVTVYDMQGRVVSRKANTSVAAGIYLVEADGKVSKVLVR